MYDTIVLNKNRNSANESKTKAFLIKYFQCVYLCTIRRKQMNNIATERCRKCKKCERICPVSGIDIAEQSISDDCIECYQCGAICPEKAINTDKIIGESSQNNIQPYDFELLMQQRRSHRVFSNQKVSPEILHEFVDRMRYSPTASNLQSLNFTIACHPQKLKEVNDLSIQTLTKAFKQINFLTKPLIRMFLGKQRLDQMINSKNKFIRKSKLKKDMITYNAPAMILIHSEKSPVGMPCHDASIWTGMAILYAELLNLKTCVNGYIVNAAKRNPKIKAALQIPDKHEIFGAILIGYPREKYLNRVERLSPKINIIDNDEL